MKTGLVSLAACCLAAVYGHDRARPPQYDPATEAIFQGTAQEVRTGPRGKILHVILMTKEDTLDVSLCPARFVSRQNMTITQGDSLEITGSKLKNGLVLARTVKKGSRTATLRNQMGVPLWPGRVRPDL